MVFLCLVTSGVVVIYRSAMLCLPSALPTWCVIFYMCRGSSPSVKRYWQAWKVHNSRYKLNDCYRLCILYILLHVCGGCVGVCGYVCVCAWCAVGEIFVATYKWYICYSVFLCFSVVSHSCSCHSTIQFTVQPTTPCFMHVLWKEKCTGIKDEYCFKL